MTSCWGKSLVTVSRDRDDVLTLKSFSDPSVVICPACGTDSYVRYCSKQHLYDDLQRHWLEDCGKAKIIEPIDRGTIRPGQIPKRAYVVCTVHNLVERHRQAVYRAMENADYFIFNDVSKIIDNWHDQAEHNGWEERIALGETVPSWREWNSVRGTGAVVVQLVFPDDSTPHAPRVLFNYHITHILALGSLTSLPSCRLALQMIHEALVTSGNWSEDMLTHLCVQVGAEWGGFKVPEHFYNVEEANTAWRAQAMFPAFPTHFQYQ